MLGHVHRGPDANNLFKSNNITLGHTRLSIVGHEEGHQPLISKCQRYGLVFNGEIYNFIEIKNEFNQIIKDEVKSDTEVLFRLLVNFGIEKTLEKINGMFAFAFVDYEKQEIVLARDRLGQKPLFYSVDEKGITFSSELKPLYDLIGSKNLTVNPTALSCFFNCFYIPSPLTIWNEIDSLLPGSYLVFDTQRKLKENFVYWEPSSRKRDCDPKSLPSLIDDATKIRMRCDVDFGAFLSGGVDSSLVVQSMTKNDENFKTFVAGIKDSLNEEKYAKVVAEKFSTDHKVLPIEKDNFDRSTIRNLVRSFGQPFADSSIIPTFLISREIAKHVKVAISGDGADEVFCGYNKYMSSESIESLFFRNKNIDFIVPEMKKNTYKWMKSRILNFEKLSKKEAINQLDIRFFLEGDILQKVDRMSMLNSLEVRSPFMDHRIVETALSLKKEYVYDERTGKKYLKDLLCETFDKDFVYRDKVGFMLAIEEWEDKIDNLLSLENILKTGFFESTINIKDMSPYLKFALLIFDIWLEEFYEKS